IQFDLRSIIERPTSGISPLRPPSASLPPLSGDRDPAMHSSSTAASNCFIFRLSTFPDGGLWYRLHNAPTIRDPPPWHSGRQMRPHASSSHSSPDLTTTQATGRSCHRRSE